MKPIHSNRFLAFLRRSLGSMAFALCAGTASAQVSQYFSQTGGLAWNTSATDWANTSGGTYNQVWGGAANDAIFEGTAGSVAVTTVSAKSLTFNVAGYSLTGSTITLAAAATITNNANASISSVLAGAGTSLNFYGPGTLTLSAANNNTYTGNTTVNSGILYEKVSGNVAWTRSTANTTINSGATIKLDVSAVTTAGQNMNIKNIAVNSGGFLELYTTQAAKDTPWVNAGAITGTGTINVTGSGNFAFNLNPATVLAGFNGSINVSNGTLEINNAAAGTGSLGNASLTLNSGTTFDDRGGFITLDALNGSGTVTASSGNGKGLTVGINNGSGNFGGVIQNGSVTMPFTKNGTGTQILGGVNTYTGATTVNGGTLEVDGSLAAGSAVTVKSGGTLSGTGTVNGTVSVNSGATLAAGTNSALGTLTLANTLTLNANSTSSMRINRTTGVLTADKINMTSTTSGIAYAGTLTVTAKAGSEAFQLGDKFTLFAKNGGTWSGSFTTINLPTLGTGLVWDRTGLTVDGSIKVTNNTSTPVFSPASGSYVGAQSVTISSDSGSTIYYTTDGTTPNITSSSGVAGSGTATVTIPTPGTMTIKAYATNTGATDSLVGTATYVTENMAVWNNAAGGSWNSGANWSNSIVPNNRNGTADFGALTMTANATVTLDSSPTIGNLTFGDAGAVPTYNWTLNAGSPAGTLKLDGDTTPVINVINQTATINAVVAGTNGLTKTGNGTLTFSAAQLNTYTGSTTVGGGLMIEKNSANTAWTRSSASTTINTGATLRLDFSSETTVPTNNNIQAITVNSGGTLELTNTVTTIDAGWLTTGGTIGGAGTLSKTGAGYFDVTYNPFSGFTGAIVISDGKLGVNYSVGTATIDASAATLTVNSPGALDFRNGTFKADGLNGTGSITRSSNGVGLSVGNNNGSGNFSGSIQNGATAFIKNGSGTQILGGANTYTGATTVNGGSLLVNGSLASGSAATVATGATLGGTGTINGAVTVQTGGTLACTGAGTVAGNVTVQTGGTLAGSGTVSGTVAVQSGGTLTGTGTFSGTPLNVAAGASVTPAGSGTIGTITVNSSLTLAGNLQLDINKTGTTLTNDQLSGTGSIALSGTLTVTAIPGDTLALNDEFQIFNVTGGVTGTLSAPPVLPALPSGLSWDVSNLLTTGTIRVSNFVATPVFTPSAGGYAGTPAVTITSDSGSTIYYTVDGTPPTTSSASGASPLNIGNLPANTTGYTVQAFARKSGQGDSAVVSATYNTLDAPIWIVNNNGDWSDPSRWLNGVIPDGIGVTADFSVTAQDVDTTVHLDGNRTVGSMTFGNANPINFTLDTLNGSVLTLATGTGVPAIHVLDDTTTISVGLTGTNGLTKTGNGKLVLSGNNTYTGNTTLNGTLAISSASNLPGGSALTFANGAVLTTTPSATLTLANNVTIPVGQTGTIGDTGSGYLILGGDYSGVNGTLIVDGTGRGDIRAASANGPALGSVVNFVQTSAAFSQLVITSTGTNFLANSIYRVSGGPSSSFSYVLQIGNMGASGNTIQVGALDGGDATSEIASDNWASVLQINGVADGNFAGKIINGAGSAPQVSLIKTGSSTQTLSGANAYTGATTVSNGTLAINGSLGNTAVAVASGATLAGTGTINGAVIINSGGFVAPGNSGTGTLTMTGNATLAGTYNCELDVAAGDCVSVTGTLTVSPGAAIAITTLGAPVASSYTIASYGTLAGSLPTVTGIPSGYQLDTSTAGQINIKKSGYDSWASSFPGLTDATPGGDPDHDGISNLMEYVIGGDPTVSSSSKLPTQSVVGSDMIFRYKRNDDSKADTTQYVEYSADMTTWAQIPIPAATSGAVTVTENGSAPDDISVAIPLSNAVNGKLFARLRVTKP